MVASARRATATRDGATSGGPATLHASFLEPTAAGPSARMRPMVTGGGGGKAGYQDDDEGNDEDCGGRRQGSSTPGPETTAVVPECQRKTGEMRGGREEVWPRESTYEDDAGPRMGVSEGSNGDARCGKTDDRGQDGKPESEEASATKDANMEVGMMVCSTAREHDKQRKGGKCAMG